MNKRPFHLTISGNKDVGAMVSVCLWATNCEQLFNQHKATFMYNRRLEVHDVENNVSYDRVTFLQKVCRQQLCVQAFFRSELDFLGVDDETHPPNEMFISNDSFIRAIENTRKFRYN